MDRNEHLLVESLVSKYRRSFREEHYGGMWKEIFDKYQRPLHDTLMHGSIKDAVDLLSNPQDNFLHFGFDSVVKGNHQPRIIDLSALRTLGVALGSRRQQNPEQKTSLRFKLGTYRRKLKETADSLLSAIDQVRPGITFPNPFKTEGGIYTSRGIASFRAIQSAYQASLLKGKVVEIGGGLGRTAYYAQCFGVKDYTIVDLPFTGISQGYFLGTVLPGHTVKIISPDEFFSSRETYDLAFNADSLTEVGRENAERYAFAIKHHAKNFISINHEANPHTVRELFGKPKVRCPYWLREGYVQEHY